MNKGYCKSFNIESFHMCRHSLRLMIDGLRSDWDANHHLIRTQIDEAKKHPEDQIRLGIAREKYLKRKRFHADEVLVRLKG